MTPDMDIIKRNFFRMLRSGAFNEYEPLEPMSVFKWKKMLGMIIQQQVMPIAANGLRNYQYENSVDIPQPVTDKFFSIYNENDMPSKVSIPQSHLTNPLLNKRLRKIRYNEMHAIDTSLETLELMNIIIYNTDKILTSGISYSNIILIGRYLRNKGNRVDFVKLERWLQLLHIQHMANFEGSILITTLNFDKNEVPFVHDVDRTAYLRALQSLTSTPVSSMDEWHFTQGQSGFIHNNSSVLRSNIWHKMKYMGYAPIETTSNLMHNIATSLSQIEE